MENLPVGYANVISMYGAHSPNASQPNGRAEAENKPSGGMADFGKIEPIAVQFGENFLSMRGG